MKREHVFQKINTAIIVIYFLIGIPYGIFQLLQKNLYIAFLSFASLLFLLIPKILNSIFHLKEVHQLNTLIYLFSFLSFTGGMVFQGYHVFTYYDKLAHTISGIFFGFLGLLLFYILKHKKKVEQEDFPLNAVFAFCFSMMVAAIWEIYEYSLDFLLHTDPQNVLTTGVHDTMQDMIVCFIGTAIFLVSVIFYFTKNKKSFLMGAFETFFEINLKKDTTK